MADNSKKRLIYSDLGTPTASPGCVQFVVIGFIILIAAFVLLLLYAFLG